MSVACNRSFLFYSSMAEVGFYRPFYLWLNFGFFLLFYAVIHQLFLPFVVYSVPYSDCNASSDSRDRDCAYKVYRVTATCSQNLWITIASGPSFRFWVTTSYCQKLMGLC